VVANTRGTGSKEADGLLTGESAVVPPLSLVQSILKDSYAKYPLTAHILLPHPADAFRIRGFFGSSARFSHPGTFVCAGTACAFS